MWVFDRFKSWRNQGESGIECPLCQQTNPEDSLNCSRCSYELAKPSHQQDATIDDNAATDLFDQLIEDFEDDDDEDIIDWSNAAFTMDDVTIDVKQYGKDDKVVTKQKPSFALSADIPEPSNDNNEVEEYELKPEDAPEFVTKFEVPETEDEPDEEPEAQQIELVQPTAESPEEVQITSASEVPDVNGGESGFEKETHPADFNKDGVVDGKDLAEFMGEFRKGVEESNKKEEKAPKTNPEQDSKSEPEPELDLSDSTVDELKAMASERGLTGYSRLKKAELVQLIESQPEQVESEESEDSAESEMPPPPTDLPPPLIPPSPPVPSEPEPEPELAIPPPPVIPSIPSMPDPLEPPNYWPWSQQDEWDDRKVAMQVKSAMESARSKDIAQATVLIDEVGPHLGNRSKLIYPIGALLQRIGRGKAVDKLLEDASRVLPEDPNVYTAKSKLRP